jgi:hypothetical protein
VYKSTRLGAFFRGVSCEAAKNEMEDMEEGEGGKELGLRARLRVGLGCFGLGRVGLGWVEGG